MDGVIGDGEVDSSSGKWMADVIITTGATPTLAIESDVVRA